MPNGTSEKTQHPDSSAPNSGVRIMDNTGVF
jgi:hypothetical protein